MSVYEVEIKAKIKDPSEVRNKLSALTYLGKRVERDVYFNYDCKGGCCRDFSRTDEAIRLRRVNGRCVLTYKGPRLSVSTKVREEIELEVSDCEAVEKFLKKLCLKPVIVIEKTRESWKRGDITITLDYVKELGWFIEIEKIVASRDEVEKVTNELTSVLSEIARDFEIVEETYLEMLLKKKGSGSV